MTTPAYTHVSRPIGKLLEMVDKGQLVLPEIQRDFVWTKKAIKMLVDSLYQGLPIGHMLVWKAHEAVESKAYHGKKLQAGAKLQGFHGYLLDGQQRLTALAHLRDGDEDYPLMYYAWPGREEDGDEPFYWRRKNEEHDPWCIPIAEVLSERFDLTARLEDIRRAEGFRAEHEEGIRRDLTALNGILNYQVGVTEFDSNDYKLATELFVRFNSTGRKLKRSDLSTAELAIKVPGLVSSEIRNAQHKWRDFRFTMPFLVQCLLAVHTGRFRLKDPERFWADARPAAIRQSWQDTEKAIGLLVTFLTGTVRWTSASQVPSFNALIPLIVVLSRRGAWSVEEKRIARRWLLLASVHGYFSTSTETVLDRTLRALESDQSVDALWNATRRSLRKLRAADFETARLSGPIMSLFLSMIRERDSRDWKELDNRLDGTVVGLGAGLQIHHFFPKALLKRHGATYEQTNTFANYVVISASTNLGVSTEEPATYMSRLSVPETEVAKQVVPSDSSLWRVSRYDEFLVRRRKMLAEEANAFLGV
jgi:hypothetical protein